MNTRKSVPAFLAAVLLALAGCTDAPLAPLAGAAAGVPLLDREALQNCDPDLSDASPLLTVITPGQRVRVDLGEGVHTEGLFRSQFEVRADGQACGQARLELQAPSSRTELQTPSLLLLAVTYTHATARRRGEHTLVQFAGEAEVCPEGEGVCELMLITGQVQQPSTDDDPVWQLHGPGVYGSARFPAQTRFQW